MINVYWNNPPLTDSAFSRAPRVDGDLRAFDMLLSMADASR